MFRANIGRPEWIPNEYQYNERRPFGAARQLNVNSTDSPAGVAQTRAEDEALRWLIDFDDLSGAGRARFYAWLREQPENRQAFERAEQDWRRLDILRELASNVSPGKANRTPDPKIVNTWLRRRRIKRHYLPLAAVASVVALALVLFLPAAPELEASYRTAIGEHRKILLPDDSVITLNTNSEASVVYTADGRDVQLHRGEAHFAIAPSSERPFSVAAGSGTVTAVGTAFNVYVRDDLVEVTVTEGVVEVSPHAAGLDAVAARSQASHTQSGAAAAVETLVETLAQGERLRYRNGVESRSTVAPGELARELAWQDGMLDFQGDPLAAVIEEASRYTAMRMTIEDPEIENLSVTGYFKAGDVETLLGLIDSNELVAVQRIAPDLVHITASRD